MSKILDNLFLGSYQDAKNQAFLQKNKITHIVTVGVELQALFPQNYKYLYIPAYDNPSYKLGTYFDQIADFIHNAIDKEKGNVFVHCFMGISRSTTSILAYLLKHHKMPLLKARNFVRSKRSIVFPNEGFVRQLTAFAKKLGIMDETASVRPASKMMSSTFSNSFRPSKSEEEIKRPDLQSTMFVTGYKTSVNNFFNETKSCSENDYHCKNCGFKMFGNTDIVHSGDKKDGSACNSLYLKFMPWMGYAKTNSAKLFCPNIRCNTIVGYSNRNGGKCPCGKPIESMHVVYPQNVVTAKTKNLMKAR